MDSLNSPWQLLLILTLTIVSSWYGWVGFRQRQVSSCLMGIGTGIPTFGIGTFKWWVIGAAVCGCAWWLKREYDV